MLLLVCFLFVFYFIYLFIIIMTNFFHVFVFVHGVSFCAVKVFISYNLLPLPSGVTAAEAHTPS